MSDEELGQIAYETSTHYKAALNGIPIRDVSIAYTESSTRRHWIAVAKAVADAVRLQAQDKQCS